MNKKTRAQASIEFLVTYGWAIMAALIVIGALAYFGVFNTQKYVNDVCYFGDQLSCEDYYANQNGTVKVQLRNNFGVPINISTQAGTTMVKSDYGPGNCNGVGVVQPGSSFEVSCNVFPGGSGTLPLNNKLKYKMIIVFSREGSLNTHNQTGDIILTVQKS